MLILKIMRIAIYGSASSDLDVRVSQKARIIGEEIAKQGHVLVTGGCGGYPYDAIKGAIMQGGRTIAYSPASNLQDHRELYKFPVEGFSELVFVPTHFFPREDKQARLKFRNITSVMSIDAAIIIGGRIGTMNEFTLCYDLGKNIGVLEGSGGITQSAIRVLIEEAGKKSASKMVYDPDPVGLVHKIQSLYRA